MRRRIHSVPVNWKKIIAELEAAGVTQLEIAAAIGVEQPTVSRYKSGDIKSCEYRIGKALIELHLLHVPQRPRRLAEPRAARS